MDSSSIDSDIESKVNRLKETSQVILVRHARSEYNLGVIELHKKNADDEEFRDLASNMKFRDWGLAPEGVEQCIKAQSIVNELSIHTVFVSCLRRTLLTAYHVFKTHPSFSEIKFIIVPKMKEAIEGCDDIPADMDQTIEEFSSLLPNLDTHLLEGYKNKTNYFLEDVYTDDPDELKGSISELIAKKFPQPAESLYSVYLRATATKKYIKEYLESNDIPKSSKIVLVSHYTFLMMYTGNWDEAEIGKHMKEPEECREFDNCEFVSDPNDYTKVSN